MNRILLLVLLTTLSFAPQSESSFQLIIPDKAQLEKIPKTTLHKSLSYRYLEYFYSSTNPLDSIEYYSGSSKDTCAFVRMFDQNIGYKTSSCEEVGQSQQITFPKTEQELIKRWIEALFKVIENKWTNDNAYEPPGAGCSYTIIQKESQTIVRIYCGC